MMTKDERAIAMLRAIQAHAEMLGEYDSRFTESMGEIERTVARAAADEGLDLEHFWTQAEERTKRGRLHVEELRARLHARLPR